MTSEGLEIEPRALEDLRASGAEVQILDVREDWEVAVCALPGSIDIPMMQIPGRVGELSPDTPVVALCHHGQRSLQAVNWLRQNGFADALSLRGGIEAWATEVDPTMARY
jgi:rhodanese-related sulfurtransferase